jgi:competence protein ComGC
MIEYPEVRQYIGKPIKSSTRLIIVALMIVLMVIATIIFLFVTDYVAVSSPAKTGQVIT